MPEGDTIFRAAASLRRWIGGREVTRARGAGLERVVGSTVTAVETRGKHLLLRFSNDLVLHTHMRMTGSWHVYPTGGPWRRPERQARCSLECGERTAVCFNAPVVELLRASDERVHGGLARLGPDVLSPGFDLDEVVRRVALRPPTQLVGEVLLDQQVVAGLGNIYRCEALFLERLDPWASRSALGEAGLRRLVEVARGLMAANAVAPSPSRDLGLGGDQRWVHQRAGRPCRRCGTTIRVAELGAQPRLCWWCPACQASTSTGA